MPDTDFSANGIDDILWYQRSTGRLGYYDMRADGGFSWRELSEIAPRHEFFPWIEIGTFLGSQNRSDIGFLDWTEQGRDSAFTWWDMTGDVNFDEYNNGRDLGGRQYIRIEGNTDITGDNYDDVFIIDDNPANSAYRLLYYLDFEGGTSPTLRDNGVRISPDDVLQYAGDFNGDGFDDLLLENEHTGYLGFLNSAENFNFVGIGKGSTDRVGNQWDVYGTGDMTDDGHDDIIWYNRANNAVGAWDMEFGAWTGWKFFGFGGENWHMETTGDFTGDGFDDILWRENTTGDTGIWDVYNEDGNWNWVYLGRPDWDWEIVQS